MKHILAKFDIQPQDLLVPGQHKILLGHTGFAVQYVFKVPLVTDKPLTVIAFVDGLPIKAKGE